jgi:dsRNA-specific ribonuclease
MADFLPELSLGRWSSVKSDEGVEFFNSNKAIARTLLNVPQGVQIYTKEEIKSDHEWELKVKVYAENIMQITHMPSDAYTRFKDLWEKAVTAESYDFNSNYEVMEKIGDKIASYVLSNILAAEFPKITPQTMSETISHTLSKRVQAGVSEQMGWSSVARTGSVTIEDGVLYYNYNNSVSEDIFESTFACVHKIGNAYYPKGGGDVYCNNLMKFLVRKKDQYGNPITPIIPLEEYADLPPKTSIEQLFKAKNWRKVIVITTKNEEEYIVKLKFTERAIADLTYHSDIINFSTSDMVDIIEGRASSGKVVVPELRNLAISDHFGIGSGYTKEIATEEAFRNGFTTLKDHKILTNIDSAKGRNQFIHSSLFPYFKKAYLAAKKYGYVNIYVSKASENISANTKSYDSQLYGASPDGNSDLLVTCIIPVDVSVKLSADEIKRMVYEFYYKKETLKNPKKTSHETRKSQGNETTAKSSGVNVNAKKTKTSRVNLSPVRK